MPASFLISFPDVPANAMVVTPATIYDTDYPVESLSYGTRHSYGRLATATTSTVITYDLGNGFSRTIDHLILGGIVPLISAGVTQAKVEGSSDGSTWVNQLGTTSGFLSRSFYGPDGQDLVFTPTVNDQLAGTLISYRYFRLTLSGGGSHKFSFSKAYFGAWFDMDKEPDNYDIESITDDVDTWRYTRGHLLMTKSTYPRHRITVQWDGVTDAKTKEFFTSILSNPYRNKVFLYTSTFLDPLYDNRLMYCQVIAEECSAKKQRGAGDWNDITAVFEEEL